MLRIIVFKVILQHSVDGFVFACIHCVCRHSELETIQCFHANFDSITYLTMLAFITTSLWLHINVLLPFSRCFNFTLFRLQTGYRQVTWKVHGNIHKSRQVTQVTQVTTIIKKLYNYYNRCNLCNLCNLLQFVWRRRVLSCNLSVTCV